MSQKDAARRHEFDAPPDQRLARIASRQHGLVSYRQLLALGLSAAAIKRRVTSGRLQAVHRGVYAVGHLALTLDGRRLAAVMACGQGAALGGRPALVAWDLVGGHPGPPFDVLSPHRRGAGLRGVRLHRAGLVAEDVTKRHAVPILTPARAILDTAASLSDKDLQRAVDRAVARHLDRQLTALTSRCNGHGGAARYRRALARTAAPLELTRSDLEVVGHRLVAGTALGPPLVNALLHGYEVDLYWPAHGLVVELDGYGPHSHREAFEHDRRKTADLQHHGLDVRRFSRDQAVHDPDWVRARLLPSAR